MAHTHPVVDSDSRFVINSDTRAITTTSDKLELIQGDHQSERITFEIPQVVEGHDMSLCDRIEIHYINIDRKTKAQSKDIYIADDVTLDGEKVVFSWLISGKATKYYGRLNFIVLFECLDEEGNYTYKWNTEICKLLTVGEGISNTESIAEDYSDIMEKFREEVLGEASQGVVKFTEQELTDEQKFQARSNIDAISEDGLVQADWTQYDETAKDYIKNRICYKDTKTFASGTMIVRTNNGLSEAFCGYLTEDMLKAFDDVAVGSNSVKLLITNNYSPYKVYEYDLTPNGTENGVYYLAYNFKNFLYHDTVNSPGVINFSYEPYGEYGSKIELQEIAVKKISEECLPRADYQTAGIVSPLRLISDYISIRYHNQEPIGYIDDDTMYSPSNFKVVTTLSKNNIKAAYGSYKDIEFLVTNTLEDDGVLGLSKEDYPIRVTSLGCSYSGEIPVSTLRIMKTDFSYADVKFHPSKNSFIGDVIWKNESLLSAVSYSEQFLTNEEKTTARNNIDAAPIELESIRIVTKVDSTSTLAFVELDNINIFMLAAKGTEDVTLTIRRKEFTLKPGGFSDGLYMLLYNGSTAASVSISGTFRGITIAPSVLGITLTVGNYAYFNAHLPKVPMAYIPNGLATKDYVNSQKFSGSYNDLTDTPTIPTVTPFSIDSTASDYSTTSTAYGDQVKTALLAGRDVWYIGAETDESGKTVAKYTKVSWFNIEKTDTEAKLIVGVGSRTDNSGAVTFAISV